MTFHPNIPLHHAFLHKRALVILISFLPYSALAVQPMTESDLEVVSATTGNNILNIFGASQAGLKVDNDVDTTNSEQVQLSTERYHEGEATQPAALNELRAIEEDSLQNIQSTQQAHISTDTQSTIIKQNRSTKGQASVFSTNSEIRYKNNNVHHEMRTLGKNDIAVSRDMQIDQLRLENLRGDSMDGGRSAGNIYLSDWSSQGDTRIISIQ